MSLKDPFIKIVSGSTSIFFLGKKIHWEAFLKLSEINGGS